jgi:hypothetical protein
MLIYFSLRRVRSIAQVFYPKISLSHSPSSGQALSAAEWVEKRREPLCRKAKKVPDTFDAPDTFN